MAKTYTFDDALTLLHNGFWWEFTDWNNRTYANLIVRDGFDYTLPTEEELNAQVSQLQADYDALDYARARDISYPNLKEFIEAYTEKEIGGDDTKWNEYVTKYNKVRTDNPKG